MFDCDSVCLLRLCLYVYVCLCLRIWFMLMFACARVYVYMWWFICCSFVYVWPLNPYMIWLFRALHEGASCGLADVPGRSVPAAFGFGLFPKLRCMGLECLLRPHCGRRGQQKPIQTNFEPNQNQIKTEAGHKVEVRCPGPYESIP